MSTVLDFASTVLAAVIYAAILAVVAKETIRVITQLLASRYSMQEVKIVERFIPVKKPSKYVRIGMKGEISYE